MLKIH